MANLLSWWWVSVLLLLPSPQPAESRNVTNEDIRDAMLSLIHMFRTLEDKLERHEYREKGLGEQLKKSFINLDKKHRTLEPIKGMISRLDERLSNVETILLQKEEREKTTSKKTNEALEGIQKTLKSLAGAAQGAATPALESKLDAVRAELEGLKNSFNKEALRAMCLNIASDVNPLEKHITEAEKLLNKYELKLSEYGNSSRVATDIVPLGEVSMADEAWHSKMTEVLERQAADIKRIENVMSSSESMWKELPTTNQMMAAANQTLAAVQEASELGRDRVKQANQDVLAKFRELSDRLSRSSRDLEQVLTQGNTMSERAYNDMARNYEGLRKEVEILSKGEIVLVQTADNVLATKKRLEYGVQQILAEVGELVKMQSRTLNHTLNDRFNNIQGAILENQSSALANLSSKIESEMSQVWRQIGTMYQQLSASKDALDKLTEQTDQYVNGSTTTIDSVKDKVGLITTRMAEVDENLNYLLGRLALVTQEFNQIKTGLGEALDRVKANFETVQNKLDPKETVTGPGPHNITSTET